MPRIQTYASRAQQQQAVREATEVLRKTGHEGRPERLITAMETNGERRHAVAVDVREGTPLAERVAATLARAAKVDARALLECAADLLRKNKPDRWLDHWGDGSVHGVDIGKVLKGAWEQLGGELGVEPEDLPGADVLAGALRNRPPDTDRVSIGYAFTEWTLNSYNTAETTLKRLETALDAATEEGRARRERAGYLLALREPRLREATRALHGEINAEESRYDSTRLFDAAQHLLDEIERILDTLEAVEPDKRAEDAA